MLIVNPRSGGGKARRYGLVGECAARGIEPIVLGPDDDITDVAATAVAGGAAVIGVAGGDGCLAPVAEAASRHDLRFVCVPAGTRNHFAMDIGIDRHDVIGALDAFGTGNERLVDLARMHGRTFVNNASMGWYGKVVQSDTYRDAKLRTVLEMVPDLVGPHAEPFLLRFQGPDGSEYSAVHLLLVSNNRYELDLLPGQGTRREMNEGALGVIAARVAPVRLEAARAAEPGELSGWLEWGVPVFRVDSDGPVEVGLDGERLKVDPPLLFESRPRSLRLGLPNRHGPAELLRGRRLRARPS